MDKYIIYQEDGKLALDETIMVQDLPARAGSKMLQNYIAPFSASLVEGLKAAGYGLYAWGQASEFSLHEGASGTVEAVAAGKARLGLGLDTGGNLARQAGQERVPALIPSTGRISSYGLIKGTSSYTRPILIGSWDEILKGANSIIGEDPRDPMALKDQEELVLSKCSLGEYKVALVGDLDPSLVDQLAEPGQVEVKYSDHIGTVFDILKSVEAASQTARYDGIRYGYRTENYDDIDQLYGKTRAESFSIQTKELIVKGYLYSGFSYEREAYDQARRLRRIYVEEVDRVFVDYDLLLAKVDSDLPALASLTSRPLAILGEMAIMADFKEDSKALSFARELSEVRNG